MATYIDVYDERLFPLNTSQFSVLLFPIFKKLKSYNQKVINNSSIRASVIVNWLRQYNIREVQEMAGHRHICSTESYSGSFFCSSDCLWCLHSDCGGIGCSEGRCLQSGSKGCDECMA